MHCPACSGTSGRLAILHQKELDAWAAIEEVGSDDEHEAEMVAAAGTSLARPERLRCTATELYDSGASRHMSPFRAHFINYKTIEP